MSTADSLRILTIDDESHHAELVADTLEAVGYPVDIAISGKEGLEKLREHPRLIAVEPGAQDRVVCPIDDVDRVDLDAAE